MLYYDFGETNRQAVCCQGGDPCLASVAPPKFVPQRETKPDKDYKNTKTTWRRSFAPRNMKHARVIPSVQYSIDIHWCPVFA